MKSMEEYINSVYKKYEEAEKSHQVYKTVKMKYYNPLTTLCGVAACLLLVCIFSVGINMWNINKKNNLEYVSPEHNIDGTIVYSKYIYVDDEFVNRIKKISKKASHIVIASNIEIKKTEYETNNEQFLLRSTGNLIINNIYKEEKNIVNKNIAFSKYCGIISLAELQKDKSYDWETWEMVNIGHTIPEEEKEISYFKQLPSKGEEIDKSKQYLVFLKYDEENDIYNIFDFAYGILEYDPGTNKVKNINTGEFEDFDWSLITEEN